MKILVTGSAGFIGYHTTKALLDRGDEVTGIDNFSNFYDPELKKKRNEILLQLKNYDFHEMDICDLDAVE